MDLLDWLLRVIESSEVGPERLSPLYTVNGTKLPPEATIEELAGYAGYVIARIVNGRWDDGDVLLVVPWLMLVVVCIPNLARLGTIRRELAELGSPINR